MTTHHAVLSGTEPLSSTHDVIFFDLDGVIYQGSTALPHAVDSLRGVRRLGVGVCFVTNNASRTPDEVAHHLVDLGIDATASDVVTSAQAAASMLAESLPAGEPVLVVGSPALEVAIASVGLRPVRRLAQVPGGQVGAVVQGLSKTLNYDDLAEATLAIRAGARWVAANRDPTLPTERGLLPGNGAFVAAIATATGAAPEVAGKPATALHREAVRRTQARNPLVVGDRLDTDVAGAAAAGVPALLVLSGVTTLDDLASASPELRPTYVAADLRALFVAQAAAQGVGGRGTCGRASAMCDEATGVVEVTVAPDPAGATSSDDGSRAAVVAAWSATGRSAGWRCRWTEGGG